MGQKVINKVKKQDSSDNIGFGEILLDIEAKNPSLTFIDEDYKEVVIKPTPDFSEEIAALTEEVAKKVNTSDFEPVATSVGEHTTKIDGLETKMSTVETGLATANDKISANVGNISALRGNVNTHTNNIAEINEELSALGTKDTALGTEIVKVNNRVDAINTAVGNNTSKIDKIDEKVGDLVSSVDDMKSDISDINDALDDIESTLTKVYKVKGSATCAKLNSSTLIKAVGDVYNVTDSGVLTDGNQSIKVNAGDNVVWVDEFWDTFGTTIDIPIDNEITVIDGKQKTTYYYNWVGINNKCKNRVSYYLITKEGYESMEEQSWGPGMTNGHFLIDSDYNGRKIGTWQKAIDSVTSEVKYRHIRKDDNSTSGQSWSGWMTIATSSDLAKYQKSSDDNLQTTSKTIVGAINEIKNNGGGGTGTGGSSKVVKVLNTASETEVELTADGDNAYHLQSSDAGEKCEDAVYLNVNTQNNSKLEIGVKKDFFVKKDIYDYDTLVTVASHEFITDTPQIIDNNDLLTAKATQNGIELNLSKIVDNPVRIVTSEEETKFSCNWMSNKLDRIGAVSYAFITKEAIEAEKVTDYPFANGGWIIDYDHGYYEPNSTGYNNRSGSLQVAIEFVTEIAENDKNHYYVGRKAYRVRYTHTPGEEGEDDKRRWSQWAIEKLDDSKTDNPIYLVDGDSEVGKDMNWVHSQYDANYGGYFRRDNVSFVNVTKEGIAKITGSGGIQKIFTEGFTLINYDVNGREYGSYQQAISLTTGAMAIRKVKKGTSSYDSWKVVTPDIDFSPYQTKAVTKKAYGTSTVVENVQDALDQLSLHDSQILESIDSKMDAYQTKAIAPSGMKGTTVKGCFEELNSKVKVLEAKGNEDSGPVEFVDSREFGDIYQTTSTATIKVPKVTDATQGTFGNTYRFSDLYEGDYVNEDAPQSRFIKPRLLRDDSGNVIGVDYRVTTDHWYDEVPTMSTNKTYGYEYVRETSSYGGTLDFYDFVPSGNVLYCVSDGEKTVSSYWGFTSASDATQAAKGKKFRLATQAEVDALFDAGFDIKISKKLMYLTTPKSTKIENLHELSTNVSDGGYVNLYINGKMLLFSQNGFVTKKSYQTSYVGGNYKDGAIFVLDKTDVATKLTGHNEHTSIHLTEGEKYKVSNLESIVAKMIENAVDKFVPIGTIMPYLPIDNNGKVVSSQNDSLKEKLVENGGNWAICDGETHKSPEGKSYVTPNLFRRAPIGIYQGESANSEYSATSYGTLKVRSKDYSRLDGGKKHYCMDGIYINDTLINATESGSNKNISISTSTSYTGGLKTWYLIRVR